MDELLDLKLLSQGMPGLSPKKGASMAEAAAVCLEENKHKPQKAYSVRGDYKKDFRLDWTEVDLQAKNTWNDLQEATEEGACCLAILVLNELTGDVVLKRSAKGTGVDYFVGSKNNDDYFQHTSRLEVSGILKGDDATIESRIRQKRKQVNKDSLESLPAIIAVTEFSTPKTEIINNG